MSVVLIVVISVAIVSAADSSTETVAPVCGEVQNLDVEETDTELIVTWDPPVESGEIRLCGYFYYIDFMIDDVGQPGGQMFLRTNNFTITKGSCVDHWIAITSSHIDGTHAAQVSIEYYSGIAGTGAVRDLRVEGLYAVWNQPENSENCGLTYQVEITNEAGEISDIVEALSFLLPNGYCLTNEASVTAIVNGSDRNGQPTSLTYTTPEGSDAPVHNFTNPRIDGAEVGWKLSDTPNYCHISEIEFTIDDSTLRVPFDPGQTLTIATITGLEPESDFSYSARWILESDVPGILSDEVRFRTVPLSSPIDLSTTPLDGGGLNITWGQLYKSEFITGHFTTVESLGPNHLLPAECPPSDAGTVYEYTSDPEEMTFFFRESRPHQYYNVTVTTLFGGLGMQTSSSAKLLTPTYTPGNVTVREDRYFKPGAPIDVTTVLSWSTPCDINGPLLRFDYKITGRLAGEVATDYCEIEFDGGQKFIDDENPTFFRIETRKVIPVFQTSLVVDTILEDGRNSTNTFVVETVPPYTPPHLPTVP